MSDPIFWSVLGNTSNWLFGNILGAPLSDLGTETDETDFRKPPGARFWADLGSGSDLPSEPFLTHVLAWPLK